MNKWIIGVIAIIVILAGLVFVFKGSIASLFGGSAATSTPTDTTPPPVITTQNYASSTMGVSVMYPSNFALNEAYAYDQFGPKKLVHGVSFTIPTIMATGTNLSSDTRISVEQLPRANKCTGDIYLLANVKAQSMTIGSTTYSVASSTGAAAGNRYDEIVYAISGSKPCTAVRYTIHYGVIENYPAGMVQEFNRSAILSAFDQIRDSLQLTTPAPVVAQ